MSRRHQEVRRSKGQDEIKAKTPTSLKVALIVAANVYRTLHTVHQVWAVYAASFPSKDKATVKERPMLLVVAIDVNRHRFDADPDQEPVFQVVI